MSFAGSRSHKNRNFPKASQLLLLLLRRLLQFFLVFGMTLVSWPFLHDAHWLRLANALTRVRLHGLRRRELS